MPPASTVDALFTRSPSAWFVMLENLAMNGPDEPLFSGQVCDHDVRPLSRRPFMAAKLQVL